MRADSLRDWTSGPDFGTKNPIWDMGEDGIKLKSKLPKYLYHGNSLSKAQAIAKGGNKSGIHLTANPDYAKSFAASAAEEAYEDKPEEAEPAALLQISTAALNKNDMSEPDNLDDVNTIEYKGKIPPKAINLVATAEPDVSDDPAKAELWSYVEELAKKHTPYMYDYIGGSPRGSGPSELAEYLIDKSKNLKALMKKAGVDKDDVIRPLVDAIKEQM